MEGERKYWDIGERDVYVRIFPEIISEINTLLFDERNILGTFTQLSYKAQHVITRLYLRKDRWVPKTDLEKYIPPDEVQNILDEVVSTGWLNDEPSVEEMLAVSPLKVIQRLASAVGIKTPSANKQQLLESISKLVKQKSFFGPSLSSKLKALLDKEDKLLKLDTNKRILLQKAAFMFLLPAYADIELMVRVNMRLVNLPEFEYVPQKDAPLFASAQEFEDFYIARCLCDSFEERTEPISAHDSLSQAILQGWETSPRDGGPWSAFYAYSRGIALVSVLIGRKGEFEREYEWVGRYLEQECHKSRQAAMYIRKILLELKFADLQKEPAWLHRALNTYFDASAVIDEIAQYDLDRKMARLVLKLKKARIQSPPVELKVQHVLPTREISATKVREELKGTGIRTKWGDSLSSVEEMALLHYMVEGWYGGHFENSAMTTMFGLLFYQALYGPQNKQHFRCRFQVRVSQLDSVLKKNHALIDEVLSNEDLVPAIIDVYERLSPLRPLILGVNWEVPLDGLVAIAHGLGSTLHLIMRRLASNYSKLSSGFPDLSLWRRDLTQRGCMFVEVKSDNDTISDNQFLWISWLLEHGVPAEVCKVRARKRPR